MTRCEQQDSLLQERGEGICPLEADHDQVGSVAPCELEGASAVSGYTRSLGGMETPGALVVARIPSVVVPVCVFTSVAKCVLKRTQSVGEMACVRACGKLKRRHFQTKDGNGEPNRPLLAILRTAPGSRDVANEACSAFSERPSRARHRGGMPVRERPAYRKRPSRGWLRW